MDWSLNMDEVFLPEQYSKEQAAELINNNAQQLLVLEKQALDAKNKAKEAKKRAEEVKNIDTRYIFNKESIIALKNSNLELAKALEATTQAQLKLQQYQTALTRFLGLSFEISLSSMAAGDAAIDQLKRIVSDSKDDAKISRETKERINETIESIKKMQSFPKMLENVKKKVNEQQEQINLLISQINTTEYKGDGSEQGLPNDALRSIINLCNANIDTIRNCYDSLNESLIRQASLIKQSIEDKNNQLTSFMSEHMSIIADTYRAASESFASILSVVYNEVSGFKMSLESIKANIDRNHNDITEQNNEILNELKAQEKRSTEYNKKTRLITFIGLGVIAALVIACLVVILVKR